MNHRLYIARHLSATGWLPFALAIALVGCGREDIKVYRVAKDTPAAPQGATPPGQPDMQAGAGAADIPPKLEWKLPTGWEEVPAGEMRLASFRIKDEGGKAADMGIFPLPGLAGKDLDNVNRWRGQVGQPPVSEAELSKLAQSVEIAGLQANVFEQAGTNAVSGDATRILAAILRREGVAWFFKLNGDDALVARQKPAFFEFLRSLKFASQPAAQLPPSHPPIAGGPGPSVPGGPADGAPAGSSEGKPKWEIPAGWQEVPGGQFLVAKFQIAGTDAAQATVNVSMSAGDGGGLAGNVNRWRGQIGLAQLPEADVQKQVAAVDTAGGKAMFVEMSGTDARTGQPATLVGAMVPQEGRSWFYKLMGNPQLVEREKNAFQQFVKNATY